MKLHRTRDVVQRHLGRTSAFRWDELVEDKRCRRGRRWKWHHLVSALWAGAVCGARNLREVETLSERMGKRVSDTTLWRVLQMLLSARLRDLLVREVRRAWRAKELESQLPMSVVAIDGKSIWVGDHEANEHCQRQESAGKLTFQVRAMRATWVSGACKLTIGQRLIPPERNECSAFGDFFAQLLSDYGNLDLLEVITADAGYVSEANARRIDDAQRGYVLALKNPQRALVDEAVRVLGERDTPDAETDWEPYQGKRIRRQLFRTTELAGWGPWSHLREVWRVRQQSEHDGEVTAEERYFVTNLPPGKMRGLRPLQIVRAHWGIENNSNWTMDTQWHEDASPWSSAAIEAVSLLRLLALNAAMRLRTRGLRSRENRARSWRDLLTLITDVMVLRGARWWTSLAAQRAGVAAPR